MNPSFSSYRGHIVRLNSIEPNTVMFSTKDYPILSDVSVPEIIDELERQFDAKLCEVQGVRQAGSKIFICLSQRESLSHLGQKWKRDFFWFSSKFVNKILWTFLGQKFWQKIMLGQENKILFILKTN